MSVHKKTVAALASHNRMRIAAGAFVPPEQPPEAQSKIGGGAPMTENAKRVIPDDFSFDPRSLKPLVQTLWAMSVALGHALTAHRQFARIKSSTISPDGMLGGRGYIMGIKDVRQRLYESCESLSAIVDTIHDEVNAAHWKPKLGELEKSEVEDLKRLLTDTGENLEDPEGEAEEDMEAVEQGRPQNWNPGGSERFDKGDEGSQLPGANGQKDAPPRPAKKPKQASYERRVIANSSVNPDTLGGPRVKHLDRAESGLPDANTERTPTEANDFGIGDGARGQGIEHSYSYGPASGLPNDSMPPVARSDYYPGPKGNDVASGALPGDGASPSRDFQIDMTPTVDYRHEQSAPRVLWDDSTHQMRPDYTYMRRPIQGPYTKQG